MYFMLTEALLFLLFKKKRNIVKYYYNFKITVLIYFKMECIPVIKAEFSASFLQSSLSYDLSGIILIG